MKKIIPLILVAFVGAYPAMANTVVVKDGDSLWKISRHYKVDFQEVLDCNKHLDNVHLIYPRMRINMPHGSHGVTTGKENTETPINTPKTPDNAISAQANEIILLVNKERKKHNLSDLTLSAELSNVANIKAQDMADNNYFSHDSPTYGSPFDMMKQFGITYKSAGENIAAGQQTAEAVMQSWLNSSGHRANILNPNFTELGVGYDKGGTYGTYWVQEFIGK